MVRARQPSRRRHRLPLAACLALLAAVTSSASTARAGDGRVVVIDVDPRVADALVVALSPWSLTVVRAPGPSPSSSIDAAAARARVMAADLHAGAVVWIAPPRPPDDQATLWVYDAQTLELAVRPITVWAPYDDAGAAAVALSVKTVLRASPLVTPEPAAPAPARLPGGAAERGAPTNASTPASADADAALPRDDAWRLETVVGIRTPTGAGAALEPRAALGASFWPSRFGGHAGLGLDVQAGPGVAVDTGDFQGELREASIEATARARRPLARSFAVELQGGPVLVLASLAGQADAGRTALNALRVDPGVSLGAVADVTLGTRVDLGLDAAASALFRFQRYSLDGAPLLSAPPVLVLLGLRLSVEVE